jgi:hypothetical protein
VNFQAISFVDGSRATAGYVSRFRARLDGRRIHLRADGKNLPILAEWVTAKTLLTKVANAASVLLGGKPADIVTASIWTLEPGGIEDWGFDPGEHVRAYLPLLPSPGAMLYIGTEGANPPVGQLTVINRHPPFSAVNLGPVAATWLVADAKLPEP